MNVLNTLTDSYNFLLSLRYVTTPRSGLLYHPESSTENQSVSEESEECIENSLYDLDLADPVAKKGVEDMLALIQLKFPGRQIGKVDMKFLGFKHVTFLDGSLVCPAPIYDYLPTFIEGRTLYFSYQNRLFHINTDGCVSKCPETSL